MLFTIIYKDIKCNMNIEKTDSLKEIKQTFILTHNLNIPIEKLLSWNDGNTPLVNNKMNLIDYNMWYENITIYFGDKYPEEVQKILPCYFRN